MNKLSMELGEHSYDINIGEHMLEKAAEYFDLNRKVFILTDSGVPSCYAEKIEEQCREALIFTVPEGEDSKSMETFELVLEQMLKFGMTRADALVSVGGGVVGDLGGFAASAYMRGITFYQVPTTVLSQMDSSIGGKCAVNFCGTKNIIGAFYQPKGVLISTDTLDTLPKRLIAEGLAESVKMALIADAKLFELYENKKINKDNIEDVIVRSLKIKKFVVESDEKEKGLRKILNFGHTLGHGIEAQTELAAKNEEEPAFGQDAAKCENSPASFGINDFGCDVPSDMRGLYHGECVALGMIPMCSDEVRGRLIPVLNKLGLPVKYDYDLDAALSFVDHDKKCEGGNIDVITVEEAGSCNIRSMSVEDYKSMVKERMTKI